MRANEPLSTWLAIERANSLSTRIAAGDRDAEEELILALLSPLRTMLWRRTGDITLATDLSHEALILLLTRLRRNALHDPSNLAGFLYRTATNLLIGHRRRLAQHAMDALVDCEDPSPSPLTAMLRSEQAKLLRHGIAALTCSRDREILRRVYLDDEEKSGVQAALSLGSAHFDRVLHRARRRLRVAILALISNDGERTGRARAVPSAEPGPGSQKKKYGGEAGWSPFG